MDLLFPFGFSVSLSAALAVVGAALALLTSLVMLEAFLGAQHAKKELEGDWQRLLGYANRDDGQGATAAELVAYLGKVEVKDLAEQPEIARSLIELLRTANERDHR